MWSDIVCPFCDLGKRRFDNVVARFPHRDQVELVWKSFQLDPALKTDPAIDLYQYLARKKGFDVHTARNLSDQIVQTGRDEGLVFNFDKAVVANTFNAHRLMHYAKEQGKQNPMQEKLFKAYLTDGQNIDDLSTLVALGQEIGLDRQALVAALESERYADAVLADINEARRLGIRSVPYFVFDRKYAISGAQDPAVFSQTLEKSFGEWKQGRPDAEMQVTHGQTCAIDGECK